MARVILYPKAQVYEVCHQLQLPSPTGESVVGRWSLEETWQGTQGAGPKLAGPTRNGTLCQGV